MSREPLPPTPWTLRRVLRMVIPSVVVLIVAWALRGQPDTPIDQPGEAADPPRLAAAPAEATLAPAPAARLLILAETDGEALARALQAKVGQDVAVMIVPADRREVVAKDYGITEFPAVVIERDGAQQDICMGTNAQAESILARCRELGWQVK